MTLKELIKRLEKEDENQVVPIGLGTPHSYRGYYEDLAFTPEEGVTVGEMLDNARFALNTEFRGYKGGTYKMHKYVQCWMAPRGQTGTGVGNILINYMLGEYN